MSHKYLNEFLKLVDHYYGQLDREVRFFKFFKKKVNENPKYETTRDERVKSFREMKELQNKQLA